MAITYRPILPSEHYFLKDMLYEAIFDPKPDLPRSIVDQPELARYIRDWGQPGDLAWVALENTQLVGAIWCRKLKRSDPGYGYIDDSTPELGIAVKPNYRNQGIGTQLLKKLISTSHKNSVKALCLSVDKRNPAVHLYQRVGFKVVGEEETAYTMKKEIT